jgi:DHA2 family multidrug resistance protein
LGLGALQLVLDKGQKEDWFSSRFIAVLTVTFVISLTFAIIWELRRKEPIINLHLFKNRDFAMATGILFVIGFGLYGSTVLLPLFLQTLMGYNSFNAGLVMSPGGLVTLVAMPVVGFLTARMPAKWLISIGLGIGAMGLFQMARFDLNLSFTHAMWSRMIVSGGLAFLFVPINTVAYARLPKQVYDQAAGLINLARNLGASFGISFVTTLLARRAQFHQNMLSNYTSEYNPTFVRMAQTIKAGLISKSESAYTAAIHSKAIIYRLMQQQAMTLSYIDAFWILGVMFILIIPLIFFLRDNK